MNEKIGVTLALVIVIAAITGGYLMLKGGEEGEVGLPTYPGSESYGEYNELLGELGGLPEGADVTAYTVSDADVQDVVGWYKDQMTGWGLEGEKIGTDSLSGTMKGLLLFKEGTQGTGISGISGTGLDGTVYLIATGPWSEFKEIEEELPQPAPNYEVVGEVTHVTDGDTMNVWIEDVVASLDPSGEVTEGTDETLRFGGGIDSPELVENGGVQAGSFVKELCPLWTKVYLDLDNLAVGGETGRPYRGKHERLVSVVYTVIDNQWVNINAELLRWGMEAYPHNDWDEYVEIESEFDMYEWPPYDNDYPHVRDTSGGST